MRVLVTGGSGFLGHNLCAFLTKRGYIVTNIDIAPFDYPDIKIHKSIQASILDSDLVHDLMKQTDFVVHSAAALPLDPPKKIKETNVEGTRLLVNAALQHQVKRFVYISSTAVYGIPKLVPITEDFPVDGVGAYGKAKVEAERIVRQVRDKMVATVLRPKSFIGKGRLGLFSIIYDWIASQKNIPLIGSGDNLYQLLDVEDLCDAIALCLEIDPNLANETFNIGATEFGTIAADLSEVLRRAGTGKKIVPLPKAPTIVALRLLSALRLSPIYPWVYETAAKESHVSVTKFMTASGWQPKRSNCESLWHSYQDYAANLSQQLPSGTGHRAHWKQGILSLAKLFF